MFAGSARQLAPLLGIQPRYLNEAVRRGELFAHRIGNRDLLVAVEVLAWLKSKPAKEFHHG